jgi:peroxiredoxin
LCARQQELADLNTRVFIISFGTLPALQQWMNETCGSFDVLIDRDRTVYQAYGLERSYWRSRTLRTRWFYFKARLAGKKTHDSHGDDTSQLGGDFIVDRHGKMRFVYPSHDPADRPTIDDLISIIKNIK